MLVEDMVDELGCIVVATASRIEQALTLVHEADFDLAIVDLNLRGTPSWPVAQALQDRGLPFILSTGYRPGALPPGMAAVKTLSKPFGTADLKRAVAATVRARTMAENYGAGASGSSSSSP